MAVVVPEETFDALRRIADQQVVSVARLTQLVLAGFAEKMDPWSMNRRSQLRRTRLKRHDAGQHKVVGQQQLPKGSARKALPARSAKRVEEAEERRALVKRVLARDGYACRAPAKLAAAGIEDPTPCGGHLDVHELIRRSAWRAGYLVDDNCLSICRFHHDWIGLNIREAMEAGLALHSTAPRPTNNNNQENP